MESLPVRRKSCLLRIKDNCPFRKLRGQTYDVLAATSSPIGSHWNNISMPTSIQPICSVSESLPPPSRWRRVRPPDRLEEAADVHMEEDPPARENQINQQNQQNRGEDCMDLDDDIDPETGERVQG